jgi:hypothetical protein
MGTASNQHSLISDATPCDTHNYPLRHSNLCAEEVIIIVGAGTRSGHYLTSLDVFFAA